MAGGALSSPKDDLPDEEDAEELMVLRVPVGDVQ